MAKKIVKKSVKKATKKTKSTGSSKASKSTKTQSRTKSSNRKTATQTNPFAQQGANPQMAQTTQGGVPEQGVYAKGGKLKRKGCRK